MGTLAITIYNLVHYLKVTFSSGFSYMPELCHCCGMDMFHWLCYMSRKIRVVKTSLMLLRVIKTPLSANQLCKSVDQHRQKQQQPDHRYFSGFMSSYFNKQNIKKMFCQCWGDGGGHLVWKVLQAQEQWLVTMATVSSLHLCYWDTEVPQQTMVCGMKRNTINAL